MSRTSCKAVVPSICATLPVLILCLGCTEHPDDATAASDTVTATQNASVDPCRSVPSSADGAYCGDDGSSGFDPTFFDARVLVTCIGQQTRDTTTCRTSCVHAAAGHPDFCNPDPCAHVSSGNNGVYCGTSTQGSFDPQEASNFFLYTCTNGRTTSTAFCIKGCTVASAGHPDFCNP